MTQNHGWGIWRCSTAGTRTWPTTAGSPRAAPSRKARKAAAVCAARRAPARLWSLSCSVARYTSRSPRIVPFYRFFFGWEGSPTKIDYRRKGTPYNLYTGGPRLKHKGSLFRVDSPGLSHCGRQNMEPCSNSVVQWHRFSSFFGGH